MTEAFEAVSKKSLNEESKRDSFMEKKLMWNLAVPDFFETEDPELKKRIISPFEEKIGEEGF